ncbi:zinc-dependent metalloprotease family protein [Methylotuvimicrobium buryatense]|nr:zinc-dependent metalloprotease family protein [Methylotuvimicrobium buryatense]
MADLMIKETPHEIYHVIKDKSLHEAAAQIANRSGIVFKIDFSVKNDTITQKLAADNWKIAIEQFLQGYNYSIELDHDSVKKVIISGRNGSDFIDPDKEIAEVEPIVIAPFYSDKVPNKYRHYNPGSVMPIDLPMKTLNGIAIGEQLMLDLPIGQYSIEHDNKIEHQNGTRTWMGYLAEEGKGYRFFVSQGESGVIGNVYTPDGEYLIDSAEGLTVLVDLERSGLQKVRRHEHNEALPPPESLLTVMNNQPLLRVEGLKESAELARARADQLASEAESALAEYEQQRDYVEQTARQVEILRDSFDQAKENRLTARLALNQSRADTASREEIRPARLTLRAARVELRAARRELRKTLVEHRKAARIANRLHRIYLRKQSLADNAEADAKIAEAAYAEYLAALDSPNDTPLDKPIDPPNETANTVVDLMVLYTTGKQTAEYARQRIQFLVDLSNQALLDSGIKMELRLVHTRATSYIESNSNSRALTDLAFDRGAFSGTAALRNQYGADVVLLFRPLYGQTSGSCGEAYIGFANGGGGIPNFAFATVSDGQSKDANTRSYCGTETFTHEVGHSFGLVHDREFSNVAGKFPYSYAWGIDRRFGTVMSYYGPSLPLFATPLLPRACDSSPCGFPEHHPNASDQTRTVNHTAPIVADYRPTTALLPIID